MLDETKRKVKRRVLVALILLSFITVVQHFMQPTVTGYVTAPFTILKIESPVVESTSFTLGNEDGAPLVLNSFKVSGKVVGTGNVKVILHDDEKKYLVYDHEKRIWKVHMNLRMWK